LVAVKLTAPRFVSACDAEVAPVPPFKILSTPLVIFDAFNPVRFTPLNDGAVSHTGVAPAVPVPVSVNNAVWAEVFPGKGVGVPALVAVTKSPSAAVNPFVFVGVFPLTEGVVVGAAAFNRNAA
jgi:hypothetical protein